MSTKKSKKVDQADFDTEVLEDEYHRVSELSHGAPLDAVEGELVTYQAQLKPKNMNWSVSKAEQEKLNKLEPILRKLEKNWPKFDIDDVKLEFFDFLRFFSCGRFVLILTSFGVFFFL